MGLPGSLDEDRPFINTAPGRTSASGSQGEAAAVVAGERGLGEAGGGSGAEGVHHGQTVRGGGGGEDGRGGGVVNGEEVVFQLAEAPGPVTAAILSRVVASLAADVGPSG